MDNPSTTRDGRRRLLPTSSSTLNAIIGLDARRPRALLTYSSAAISQHGVRKTYRTRCTITKVKKYQPKHIKLSQSIAVNIVWIIRQIWRKFLSLIELLTLKKINNKIATSYIPYTYIHNLYNQNFTWLAYCESSVKFRVRNSSGCSENDKLNFRWFFCRIHCALSSFYSFDNYFVVF